MEDLRYIVMRIINSMTGVRGCQVEVMRFLWAKTLHPTSVVPLAWSKACLLSASPGSSAFHSTAQLIRSIPCVHAALGTCPALLAS